MSTGSGSLGRGEVTEVEDKLAKKWVAQGVAEPVKDEAPKDKPKAKGKK